MNRSVCCVSLFLKNIKEDGYQFFSSQITNHKINFFSIQYKHCFQKQIDAKAPSSKVEKCLLPSIVKLFEEIFSIEAEPFKTQFNLISLSFCSYDHRRIALPHPLSFESVVLGVCAFETQLFQDLAWKSATLVLDLWA